jgi:integrative and conjugative element protein (TIGR02256 family)
MFPGSTQRLRIEPSVLDRVRRYRQSKLSEPEAGGQLFGMVTPQLVTVNAASGPHRSDERSRYSFRSDPRIAQSEIKRFAGRGLVYLGEWHTHAEAQPRPSESDRAAVLGIVEHSRLNTSNLVLIIIGLAEPNDDLGVWYLGPTGALTSLT